MKKRQHVLQDMVKLDMALGYCTVHFVLHWLGPHTYRYKWAGLSTSTHAQHIHDYRYTMTNTNVPTYSTNQAYMHTH
jgi:hypothetical protein